MKIKNSKWLFLLGYLVYSTVYICRLNLSVAAPVLQQEGILTKAQYGLFGSVFFITYSFGRLFNGYLGDRLRTRVMIGIALTGMGVTNLLIGAMPPVVALLIFWGLNGYSQSMIWGPLLRLVSSRYDEKRRSLMVSALASSIAAGSIVGILLATYTAGHFGVELAFVVPGVLALLVGAAVALFMPDDENPVPQAEIHEKQPRRRLDLLRIGVAMIPAFLHGVIKDNVNSWAPDFFVEQYGIDLDSMALFVFVIPLLGLVGRLVYPLAYKLCRGREHLVSVIGFGVCILALLPLCLTDPGTVVAAVCLSVIAAAVQFINTSMLSMFPMRFAREGAISTVAGLMDFATYMGAGIGSAIYGAVLERTGYGVMFSSWLVISVMGIGILMICQRREGKRAVMQEGETV